MRSLFWILVTLSLVLLWAGPVPGQGQGEAAEEQATVVLDGRPLFNVATAGEVTADERAQMINEQLAEIVQDTNATEVDWETRDGVPVLVVNDRYLMTVTQADAQLQGRENPVAQAIQWEAQLDQELEQAHAERQQQVLIERAVMAAGILLLALGGHILIGRICRRSLQPAMEHLLIREDTQPRPTGLNLLVNLSLILTRIGLWLGALFYVTDRFPLTRRWSYFLRQQLISGFIEPNLKLGQREFSILSLLVLVAMLVVLVVLAGIFTNFLRSRILQLTGIDRGSCEAVAVLFKYGVIFVGGVVMLQIWGLDLSSLALIASALGVGVGLGLQNIAKDFGSGIVLVFERPIQVGDFVEFGEFQGTVERIGARSTEIKTLDQISIIVPNSRFLEQEVINWSHRNPISRIRIPVGVAYKSHPPEVRDVLLSVSKKHSKVLATPPPVVFFMGFGDSALLFELLVWIAEPHKQLPIRSDLYFAIEAGLRSQGIEIPFPQRDLHIRSGHLPIQMSSQDSQFFSGLPGDGGS